MTERAQTLTLSHAGLELPLCPSSTRRSGKKKKKEEEEEEEEEKRTRQFTREAPN